MDNNLILSIERLIRLMSYNKKLVLGVDGSLSITTKPAFDIIKFDKTDTHMQFVCDIITQICKKSEYDYPGSSFLALKIVKQFIEQGSNHDELNSYIDIINQTTTQVTTADIHNALSELFSEQVVSIIQEAVLLAGAERSIHVELSTDENIIVKLNDGYMFNAEIEGAFYEKNKWIHENVKCMIVDGIIQNVSEIDTVLQKCHETKTPLAIFCRGISEDVRMTLLTNKKRKTLNVIPIVMKFGIETANSLADVATILKSDVVSSLKGDLISTVKFNNLSIVDKLCCERNVATLYSKIKQPNITTRILELQKKRNQSNDATKRMILDMRIRSLIPTHVVIRIPNQGIVGATMIADLDAGLRIVKSLLRFGVIHKQDISNLTLLCNEIKQTTSRAKIIKSIKLASSIQTIINSHSFSSLSIQ